MPSWPGACRSLQPANVAEYLEFGLYGWELSRFSGAWVGIAALSEVVESAGTVDLDLINARVAAWADADTVRAATGHRAPADGLHYRWPDLPSLRIESRLADKLDAVAAFARVNSIDRHVIESPHAKVGIVTCGKAHYDLMEVLRRLEVTPESAGARRRAALQGGPELSDRADAHARPSRRAWTRSWSSRRRARSSRRSCATCSTTRRPTRGRRSSASTTATAGRWCRRSASCGLRG